MDKDKLQELLEARAQAEQELEKLLTERHQAMKGKTKPGHAAHEFFKVYDLDGDGFITREEWGGSAAVFAALDTNGDGRISPEEMGAGLGGAFVLAK